MIAQTHPIRRALTSSILVAAVAATGALLGHPGGAAAQSSQLTPLGSNQSGLSGCDDCSDEVSITDVFPSGINLGGSIYTTLHVGTNGYITFGHENDSFDPSGIAGYSVGPIVAPQFDDLDPSKGGDIYYDQNAGAGYLVVSWVNVEAYSSPVDGSGGNSFQVVLRTQPDGGVTDFDLEIRYNGLDWAQSGNIGTWPTAGWSAGDQATYAELPQSGQSNFRDVQYGSNVGSEGVYRWEVIDGVVRGPPAVSSTSPVTAITGSSAQSGGNVSSAGGLTVTERGLAYDTNENPTISDHTVTSGTGTGSFTATMTGLDPNTTYHVRAYATNSAGTTYGNERSFTTPKLSQTITFPEIPGPTYGDDPFAVGATASSELPVAYASDAPEVATVTDGTVTIVGAGTAVITATQAGDDQYAAADPVERTLIVAPKPIQGTFSVPAQKVYDEHEDTEVTARGLLDVEPDDQGDVQLVGGTATYETFRVGDGLTVTLGGAELSGPRAAHYALDGVQSTTADIVPGPSDHFTIDGPSSVPSGHPGAPFTLTIRDAYGNPTALDADVAIELTTDASEHGTAGFTPADRIDLEAGSVEASFHYWNSVAGTHRVVARLVSGSGVRSPLHDAHEIEVSGGAAVGFGIEAVDGGSVGDLVVGEPFTVRIVAQDAQGNPTGEYDGPVSLSADGALGAGLTAELEGGMLESHDVRFDAPGTFTLRIEGPGGVPASSHVVRVLESQPVVDVEIHADDWSPALGQIVTIEVTATNRGAATARGVEVQNPLRGQARLEALEITVEEGAVEPSDGPWKIGNLDPGASATMRIRARVVVPE